MIGIHLDLPGSALHVDGTLVSSDAVSRRFAGPFARDAFLRFVARSSCRWIFEMVAHLGASAAWKIYIFKGAIFGDMLVAEAAATYVSDHKGSEGDFVASDVDRVLIFQICS